MKKIVLNIVLLLLGVVATAQNNFVYVRYDNTQGNPSDIVRIVNRIITDTRGSYVIFYSNGDNPILCENAEEWETLSNRILTQQNLSDFYPEEEFIEINNLFTKYFKEEVTIGPSLSINGTDDSTWSCTFILPESMLMTGFSLDYYSRILSVNQLFDRMGVTIYSYNDEGIDKVEFEKINNNSLFIYF